MIVDTALAIGALLMLVGLSPMWIHAHVCERLHPKSFLFPAGVFVSGWSLGVALPTGILLAAASLVYASVKIRVDRRSLELFRSQVETASSSIARLAMPADRRRFRARAEAEVATYSSAIRRHYAVAGLAHGVSLALTIHLWLKMSGRA